MPIIPTYRRQERYQAPGVQTGAPAPQRLGRAYENTLQEFGSFSSQALAYLQRQPEKGEKKGRSSAAASGVENRLSSLSFEKAENTGGQAEKSSVQADEDLQLRLDLASSVRERVSEGRAVEPSDLDEFAAQRLTPQQADTPAARDYLMLRRAAQEEQALQTRGQNIRAARQEEKLVRTVGATASSAAALDAYLEAQLPALEKRLQENGSDPKNLARQLAGVRAQTALENVRRSVAAGNYSAAQEVFSRYEKEMEELDKNRKDILKKAKEDAEKILQESNARIENTIRTIKEAQADKERTRQARQELTDFRREVEELEKAAMEEKIARKMDKIREKQERRKERKEQKANESKTPAEPKVKPIQEDDYVRIKGQTSTGQVLEINGKNAVVMFGLMKTNVKTDRLEHAPAPKPSVTTPAKASFVSTATQSSMYQKKLNFKHEIDLRGMRADEAIQAVTYFIDDAILVGAKNVRILHGTGSGILRTLIRQYLATVPGVTSFHDEHVQFGGAGITVVNL